MFPASSAFTRTSCRARSTWAYDERLGRIRQVAQPGEYAGDASAEQFKRDDRLHVESGLDLVRTRERPGEIAAARAKAAEVGKELDQAFDTLGPVLGVGRTVQVLPSKNSIASVSCDPSGSCLAVGEAGTSVNGPPLRVDGATYPLVAKSYITGFGKEP